MSNKNQKDKPILKTVLFIWNNLDALLSIILAFIAIVLSRIKPTSNWPPTIIATVVGLIAVAMLKDRKIREAINDQIEEVKSSLLQIVEKVVADDFFSNKTNEHEIIKKVEKEIVLIQETGQLIAETCRQELLQLVRGGGKIRWVSVLSDKNIAELMSYRNANLITTDLIISRMNNGTRMIEIIANEAKEFAKNIEVRYVPYPIDITAVFKDPYHKSYKEREALIRLQGFRVTYDDKLDFKINSYYSKSVFDLYLKQMENIWRSSTKCIFLTGKPGIGKSTLLKKVVDTLIENTSLNLIGFLTKDIKDDNNKRIGFETSVIKSNISGELARKQNDGYELNEDTMKNVIIPALQNGIDTIESILIIDEIGPIQLKSKYFKDLIERIIENKHISVLGIVAESGHPYLQEIHRNIRTGIIEVNLENREMLHEQLFLEFAPRRVS